jgi:thiol-disulfide isomerase/thioredoxin
MRWRLYAMLAILTLIAGAAQGRGRSELLPSSPARTASAKPLPSRHAVFEKLAAAGFGVPTREILSTDFKLELLGGGGTRLNSYRGSLVLLNFWTTWCPSCRAEIPSMEKLYSTLRKNGFVIVAVDLSESREVVKSFVTANKMIYPVLLDSAGNVGALYGAQSIPTTYIIGRDGRILGRTVGSRDWSAPTVVSLFESLLAG